MSSVTVDKVCYWYCSWNFIIFPKYDLDFKMLTGTFELLMNVEFMMDIKKSAT